MTITASNKLLSLMIPLGMVIAGCADPQASSLTQGTTTQSAVATISNMLPVDGCSYPVTIDGVDYAPDEESMIPLRDKVQPGQSITVAVNYDLTGENGTVECGFGNTWELPQIWFRLQSASQTVAPQPTI